MREDEREQPLGPRCPSTRCHSVSMPMLLLLSCAVWSQTQNKAVAQWGVCACLCATVALAKQAPADQEPRELRRANCCVLRRRVMEPHSLSATLCAKRYCTWLGGAGGRRAAPWWGRRVARARAEELKADLDSALMNVSFTDRVTCSEWVLSRKRTAGEVSGGSRGAVPGGAQ